MLSFCDVRTWSVQDLRGNFKAEVTNKTVRWADEGNGYQTSQHEDNRIWGLLKREVRVTKISIHGYQVKKSCNLTSRRLFF